MIFLKYGVNGDVALDVRKRARMPLGALLNGIIMFGILFYSTIYILLVAELRKLSLAHCDSAPIFFV